jgi:GTP-binding protein
VQIREVLLQATVASHREGPKASWPQIAFAGRSNVGKSSLLNALFGRTLAATSKHPGKTRTINYYLVNRAMYFVDLPGYGFAKVAKSERAGWGRRVTEYVVGEDRLRLVVALVDPRIPTSPLDRELLDLLRACGRDFLVVMTKSDCLGRGALATAAQRLRRDLELPEAPLAVSARAGTGTKELLTQLAAAASGARRVREDEGVR